MGDPVHVLNIGEYRKTGLPVPHNLHIFLPPSVKKKEPVRHRSTSKVPFHVWRRQLYTSGVVLYIHIFCCIKHVRYCTIHVRHCGMRVWCGVVHVNTGLYTTRRIRTVLYSRTVIRCSLRMMPCSKRIWNEVGHVQCIRCSTRHHIRQRSSLIVRNSLVLQHFWNCTIFVWVRWKVFVGIRTFWRVGRDSFQRHRLFRSGWQNQPNPDNPRRSYEKVSCRQSSSKLRWSSSW